MTARVVLANEKGDVEREAEWRAVRGFAEMSMEDRVKSNGCATSHFFLDARIT